MRSKKFTFFLAILSVVLCGLTAWRLTRGNLDALFGANATQQGECIYNNFAIHEVKKIRVTSLGTKGIFVFDPHKGWQCQEPWQDRMNPIAAQLVIEFSLNLKVEDSLPSKEVSRKNFGLDGSNRTEIELYGANNETLAHYRIGYTTPLQCMDEGQKEPQPTVYIQALDHFRQYRIYACTGKISDMFKNQLKFFRDPHPFLFNPNGLNKIEIQNEQGDLTLEREGLKSPWKLTKPMQLGTDPVAVKKLLEGLFKLNAVNIETPAAATAATNLTPTKEAKPVLIRILPFGQTQFTTLKMESLGEKSSLLKAEVSDRPNTNLFYLKNAQSNLAGVLDLPLSVNALRDSAVLNLNIASLREIQIRPQMTTPFRIIREGKKPWSVVTDQSKEFVANEQRLFALLKMLKSAKAQSFDSDAVSDFHPYGLDVPFLSLTLKSQQGEAVTLKFGNNVSGDIFVNREGSTTVMKMDPKCLDDIPLRLYEWLPANLWAIDPSNLVGISRQIGKEAPLRMLYVFADESWRAVQAEKDVSADLNPFRASNLLKEMEHLQASHWLEQDDSDALNALKQPIANFSVVQNTVDDLGDKNGRILMELTLAPATGAFSSTYFYGKTNQCPHPFLIDKESIKRLMNPLLEK